MVVTANKPQKTKKRFFHLSAIKPNKGWEIEEVRFEALIIRAATAIVMPNFAAMNGKIGFKNPEYASNMK